MDNTQTDELNVFWNNCVWVGKVVGKSGKTGKTVGLDVCTG